MFINYIRPTRMCLNKDCTGIFNSQLLWGVTAHFVAPAQFVVDDKTCSLNSTFCHPLHTLSPQGDKMCSCSRHILSPERERERIHHVIKSDFMIPSKKHENQTPRSATNEPTAVPQLTYYAHIVTMLPEESTHV